MQAREGKGRQGKAREGKGRQGKAREGIGKPVVQVLYLQTLVKTTVFLGIIDGADGGGRTHTLSRVLDFESSASANSATSATLITKHLCRLVLVDVDAVLLFVLEIGHAKQCKAKYGLSRQKCRCAF